MGLRLALLKHDDWTTFVDSYDRVTKTSSELFRGEILSAVEREEDLHHINELREMIHKYDLV